MAQHIGEQDLARLMIGGKMLHRRRLRQALLANILADRGEEEGGSDEAFQDEAESGTDEHRLARLLIGSSIVRRRRLRALMLAHLLHGKHEAAEEEEGGGGGEDVGGEEGEEGESGNERRLARLLIGSSVVRRRRLRALMLTHLLREKHAAAEGEEDTGEEIEEGEGDDSDHQLARLLIGSGVARRQRLRRALVEHALRGAG